MKNKVHILLVEDDSNLSLVLQDYLEMLGYRITLGKDGREGLEIFKKGKFDLCIFDVMLPHIDGFTLAEEVRKMDQEVPVIFLTAKAFKEDRITGFKAGCDDYITKPFSTEELSLRIQVILKRCQTRNLYPADYEEFVIGKYIFDYSNMTLTFGDKTQILTKKEAELLRVLCEYKNKLLKREIALKRIWGDDDYFIGRSMDVFITKLRKYLKEDPAISITNVHGTGFKLEVEDEGSGQQE